MNYYKRPTFSQRVWAKLLPAALLDASIPEWAQDGVHVGTRLHLTVRDRLAVALTGCVAVETFTACEHKPGRVETKSVGFPCRRHNGQVQGDRTK